MRTTIVVWMVIMQVTMGADAVAPIPKTIHSMKYPQLGLQAQISGTVRLRVTIDKVGIVSATSVVSGNSILASAAEENVKRWRFFPGVSTSFELFYEFKLQGTTDSCAQTDFVFESPNKIVVLAPALHWMP